MSNEKHWKEGKPRHARGPNYERFAGLYSLAYKEGRLELPVMGKAEAHSLRQQLNRFRQTCRESGLTQSNLELLEVVKNKLVCISEPLGQYRVVMDTDTTLINELDAILGRGLLGTSSPSPAQSPVETTEDSRINHIAEELAREVERGGETTSDALATWGLTPEAPQVQNEPLERDPEYYTGQVENKPINPMDLFKDAPDKQAAPDKPDVDK